MNFKFVIGNECFDESRQRIRREQADLQQLMKTEKIPNESATKFDSLGNRRGVTEGLDDDN